MSCPAIQDVRGAPSAGSAAWWPPLAPGRAAGRAVSDTPNDAARAALARGAVAEARRLADEAFVRDDGAWRDPAWVQVRDVHAWPDAWLVAAVRAEPPDAPALDALVARYWKVLVGRCHLLTADRDRAADLAQDTWLRMLRARPALDPQGSFPAYLVTTATNLWRDRQRAARRAGPLAEQRLASLDGAPPAGGEDGLDLTAVLPDPHAMSVDDQVLLAFDVDRALARLDPRAREVLVARVVAGESCAEIGRRFGRTEQTVSAWVRQASRTLRDYLGQYADGPVHDAAPAAKPRRARDTDTGGVQ